MGRETLKSTVYSFLGITWNLTLVRQQVSFPCLSVEPSSHPIQTSATRKGVPNLCCCVTSCLHPCLQLL